MGPFNPDSIQRDAARRITELASQYREARVLQVAVNVGIFETLAQGDRSTEAIAASLDLDPVELAKVMGVLEALGLLTGDAGGWSLTADARVALDPQSPVYQGNMIAHHAMIWDRVHQLESRLRAADQPATPAGPLPQRDAQWHRHFILAMHNLAMAGNAEAIVDRIDLSDAASVIDIGGGPGTYLMALCERYPNLQATLFDLPETVAIAGTLIDKLGYADRIATVEGSWDDEDWGGPFDALIMSNVLHGPTSGTEAKLAKAHRTLSPGGQLILQDFVTDADVANPLIPALFNVMVGTWSLGELLERIEAAGFVDLHHQPTQPAMGTTLITARRG